MVMEASLQPQTAAHLLLGSGCQSRHPKFSLQGGPLLPAVARSGALGSRHALQEAIAMDEDPIKVTAPGSSRRPLQFPVPGVGTTKGDCRSSTCTPTFVH